MTMKASERKFILKAFNNKCFVCGYKNFLDIHHIKHKSDGGQDIIENVIVLCSNHHKEWHYLENTFIRACQQGNNSRGANERISKALNMSWKAMDDYIEGKKIPCFNVPEQETL